MNGSTWKFCQGPKDSEQVGWCIVKAIGYTWDILYTLDILGAPPPGFAGVGRLEVQAMTIDFARLTLIYETSDCERSKGFEDTIQNSNCLLHLLQFEMLVAQKTRYWAPKSTLSISQISGKGKREEWFQSSVICVPVGLEDFWVQIRDQLALPHLTVCHLLVSDPLKDFLSTINPTASSNL